MTFSITSGLPIETGEQVASVKRSVERSGDRNARVKYMAEFLVRTSWFLGKPQHGQAKDVSAGRVDAQLHAAWIVEAYDVAYSFRQARSRLWLPNGMSQTLREEGQAIKSETQLDYSLKKRWMGMTAEARKQAIISARFECIRRLGWRKGYSSGYPLDAKQKSDAAISNTRKGLIQELGSEQRSKVSSAWQALASEEEQLAWHAWEQMDNATRAQEERLMWAVRDRSMIYIDDTTTSTICGVHAPRWYHQPQKIGDMTFLPNVLVRLVRNATAKNSKYDAFKATFRVPLSMHKHGLRSYLLAIYGLRTTWCRSAIYRAPIERTRLGQKKVGHARRTFKKVEVGLLEPFVFPEISQAFLREQLQSEEMKAESSSLYFKLSGRRRWRAKQAPTPAALDPNAAAVDADGVAIRSDEELETTAAKGEDKQERPSNRLTIWGGGVRTKRRSRILKLVHEKRLAREAEIATRMEELRR